MDRKPPMSPRQTLASSLGTAAWILAGLLGVVLVAAYSGPDDTVTSFGYATYFMLGGVLAVVVGLAAAACLLACLLAGERLRPTSWLAAGVPGAAALAAVVWISLA